MKNKVFTDAEYYYGWNTLLDICLWGEIYTIVVSAQAYAKTEAVTKEQEDAYSQFLSNLIAEQKTIELLLDSFVGDKRNAKQRFIPKTLLFEKNGNYTLLCDDRESPDEGVAVCLSPQKIVISQDEYL